jgi:hypothetical protein
VAIDGDPGADPCAFVIRHVKSPRRWVVRREPQTAERAKQEEKSP